MGEAVGIIAIGFLHTISRCEEKLLLARFGEEYEQYMREVPMWIPRWIPRSKPWDAPPDEEADRVS